MFEFWKNISENSETYKNFFWQKFWRRFLENCRKTKQKIQDFTKNLQSFLRNFIKILKKLQKLLTSIHIIFSCEVLKKLHENFERILNKFKGLWGILELRKNIFITILWEILKTLKICGEFWEFFNHYEDILRIVLNIFNRWNGMSERTNR